MVRTVHPDPMLAHADCTRRARRGRRIAALSGSRVSIHARGVIAAVGVASETLLFDYTHTHTHTLEASQCQFRDHLERHLDWVRSGGGSLGTFRVTVTQRASASSVLLLCAIASSAPF